MVKKRQEFPKENDLVICTVTKVFSHGAFAKLDEYEGREGFIHISEIASKWVKNIRDFVKEGQKTVAKVLGIDPVKGNIDLSVRRVGSTQKKNKMREWKREQKAEKLLELVAKQIGETVDKAYEEVGFKLEDEYGEIYGALEEISSKGEKALEGIDISRKWIKPLIKTIEENVTIALVRIRGYLDLRCTTSSGVEVIKDALIKARDENSDGNVKLEVHYVGSPKYRIKVTAPDYKTAENVLKNAVDMAISMVKRHGGEGSFIRG